MTVIRTPWEEFPACLVHAWSGAYRAHPLLRAALAGEITAAVRLAAELWHPELLAGLKVDYVVGVHDTTTRDFVGEGDGFAVPQAFAGLCARATGGQLAAGIVQETVPSHEDAWAISHLLAQPGFAGEVIEGGRYLIASDVLHYGAAIANLRGYIISRGGRVVSATALCQTSPFGGLTADAGAIETMKRRFGRGLDDVPGRLGFALECLTGREAYFLCGLMNLEPLWNAAAPTHREVVSLCRKD